MSLINKLRQGANFLYENSPAAWAMRNSEAMQLRAESRERDYNSPKAQMNRYKEAGLNPALIYGGGASGASGNVGSKAPQAQVPQGLGSIAQYMLQAVQTGASIANISSQSSLRATQRDVGETVIGRNLAQTDLMRQQYGFLEQVNPELARYPAIKNLLTGRQSQLTLTENSAAHEKMQNLVKMRELMDQDGKIKASILSGKNIMNDLLDAERDWIRDGDFTSTQFWQVFLSLIKK